jgi:hypothetical protein
MLNALRTLIRAVHRLDLVAQINEIEARKEEYPETLAFIRLLNSLVAAAMLRDLPGGGATSSGRYVQVCAVCLICPATAGAAWLQPMWLTSALLTRAHEPSQCLTQ